MEADPAKKTTPQERQAQSQFIKLLMIVVSLWGLFLYFNSFLNWQILVLIIVIPVLFWGFKDKMWMLLVASPPALLWGEVMSFSVIGGWTYEASVAEVFLFLTFIVFILDRFIKGTLKELKVDTVLVFLGAYLALSLLSFFYAVDIRFFVYGLKIITFSFLAYFLALNLLNDHFRIKWFLRSIFLTVLILSFQTFIKFYQMGFSSRFFFERHLIELPVGPIALIAALLVFMLPLTLAFFFWRNKGQKERFAALFVFFAGFTAVFLSLGKAAILSLGVALFYLFVKLKRERIFFILFGAGFAALAFILFSSFLSGLIERISRTFVSENTQFRVLEYRVGWEIISDHFARGVGVGQQLAYYKSKMDWNEPQLVNNFALQAFIELGVIGLGIVFGIVVAVFKKIGNKIKQIINPSDKVLAYGFIGSFIAVFINGLAEVTIFAMPYAIIFWLVLGVFNNIEKYA